MEFTEITTTYVPLSQIKAEDLAKLVSFYNAFRERRFLPYHLEGAVRFPKTIPATPHTAFCFAPGGTILYVLDNSGVILPWGVQKWDPSVRTVAPEYGDLSISGQVSDGRCMRMSPDGTQLYVSTDAGTIHQWTLSTPLVLSSASYVGNSGTTIQSNLSSALTVNGFGFDFAEDGGHLIVGARNNIATASVLADFDLPTEWDITSLNYQSLLDVFSDGVVQSVVAQNDGQQILVLGADALRSYYLETPSQTSSAELYQTLDISGVLNTARNLAASPDGTKVFASAPSGTNANRIQTWFTTKLV